MGVLLKRVSQGIHPPGESRIGPEYCAVRALRPLNQNQHDQHRGPRSAIVVMSVLPPEVHSSLAQLLQALSSADNGARAQAEEKLSSEWVRLRPDVLLMGLVEQIQGSEEPQVRDPRSTVRPSPSGCALIKHDR